MIASEVTNLKFVDAAEANRIIVALCKCGDLCPVLAWIPSKTHVSGEAPLWGRTSREKEGRSSLSSVAAKRRRGGDHDDARALVSHRGPPPAGARRRLFLQNVYKILANFWRARSRLYRNEILQENMRLTAFFKLYKICILLHRCNLSNLKKQREKKKKQHLVVKTRDREPLVFGLFLHLRRSLLRRLGQSSRPRRTPAQSTLTWSRLRPGWRLACATI